MLFRVLHAVSATSTVGLLIGISFLLPERNGVIGAKRYLRFLSISALIWFVATALNLVNTLANLFERPFLQMLDGTTMYSYMTQTTLGRLQSVELFAAFFVMICAQLISQIGGGIWLLLVASIGVIAPIFQSHSSQAGSHGLAIGSLIIHVFALSWWLGTVFIYFLMNMEERKLAKPRVSTIALWASVAVITSGLLNSWTRLRLSDQWLSTYGLVILLKISLMLIVLYIASQIRKRSDDARLIRVEVGVLAVILGLGSILNRFTPIDPAALPIDPVREQTGIPMPAAPTLSRVFFEYEADGLMLGALIFATALYIRGVVALSRKGARWPVGRTISFAIGISLLDYATSGGLGLYAHFSFQYHMIAHMTLGMIAPIALVLSAPITLALKTLPIGRDRDERGIRKLLLVILDSRWMRFITNPLIALGIFDGSLFLLYFTPLFGKLMSTHFGHLVMDVHFIAVGFLFFHVIVGIDPNPRKIHHLARVVVLFAAMSIHAFFAVALMSATTLIDNGYFAALNRPWATDLLSDQKVGAAIGWAMGEVPIVIALIATFIQWLRSDAREARRADRHGEADLAAYNEYLTRLAERDK